YGSFYPSIIRIVKIRLHGWRNACNPFTLPCVEAGWIFSNQLFYLRKDIVRNTGVTDYGKAFGSVCQRDFCDLLNFIDTLGLLVVSIHAHTAVKTTRNIHQFDALDHRSLRAEAWRIG